MNDISARIAASPLPVPVRGADSTQTPPGAALDNAACPGTGLLSGRRIAVGDGLSTQRLRGSGNAILAQASPQVRAMLQEMSEGPAGNGVIGLKQRQLGLGSGKAVA
ncbi:hypothetical protein [Comamonas endophytica]|uniref:Uncharacterized protein n=1 Tax=Comamonas endophytica TaxID=2949090 RepID=A0ABY6GBL7_9BURK|nr:MULTISPECIES: hypothetical protein [unclassified Acidovorax]MCD2513522.1 hypothetical protein [Acidovorax sp. D4N7]UYG52466.1 hypothetical protein M9799_04270 [Acidovorax sp. 5MLIR]